MSEKETDFLDDMKTPEPAEAAPPAAAEGEAPAATETGDTATATPPEAAAATPAAPIEKEHVPLAALKAEREKRQREQSQREALQRELDALKAAKEQQAAPTFYENPEAFVSQIAQSVQQQADARLFAVLEAEVREQFEDFQEVMDELVERVNQNPTLRDQIFKSPNPPKAAYRLGKQLRELDAMQDPDAYRQKLELELRAKWDAEQKAKEDARAQAAAAVPPDLASARSSTGNAAPAPGSVFQEIFN